MSFNNPPIKIKEIQIYCNCHATEDLEKVEQAILNIIPEDIRGKVETRITKTQGHAGNSIILIELKINHNKLINSALNYLVKKISDIDKEYLYQVKDNHLDKNNCFYIRFDKQAAFNDILNLDNGDNTIRLMIKFILYKREINKIFNSLENIGLIKKA